MYVVSGSLLIHCSWFFRHLSDFLALSITIKLRERIKKVKEMIRFFITYGFKINNLVGDSLFFVAMFIVESLEGILMAILYCRSNWGWRQAKLPAFISSLKGKKIT